MAERVPQSVALRVSFEAYLAGTADPATGKTIAITISKNGAAYGNPSGGATNATEIGSGSYYVDLSTTDTGTAGPLIVKGTEGTIDTVKDHFRVVDAHNAGFDGVPSVAIGSANCLARSTDGSAAKTGSGYVSPNWGDVGNPTTSVGLSGTTIKAVTDGVTISGTPDVNLVEIAGDNTFVNTLNTLLQDYANSAFSATVTGVLGDMNGNVNGKLLGGGAGSIAAVGAWVFNDQGAAVAPASTALSNAVWTNAKAAFLTGDAFARLGLPAGASTAADIAAINAKTTNLPASPAAVGSLMGLADGAITDAKITFPGESAGRPTTFLAAMRRVWEWTVNKRIRTRSTGAVQLRNAADGADLETQTQSTTGSVGSEVDTQTKGA